MPPCSVGNKCVCPTAPLDGRHLCAICKKDLHGPCGVFNGDDGAITYRNRCFSCTATDSASESDESTSRQPTEAPAVGHQSIPAPAVAASTQQAAVVSAKDVEPKKVSWEDIVGGDRPSTKAGDNGSMQKSVATICGFDAMTFNTEQLRGICSSLKLTGYRSKPKAELLRIIGVRKSSVFLSGFRGTE